MRIVAVQLDSVWEDKAANHQKVRDLLATADVQPDSLVIVPEMFDTGFSMNLDKTAQSADRESERFLKQIADEYSSAVLGGVVEPAQNGLAKNMAICFDPDGIELARYHKMQPFTPAGEHEKYGAGDTHRVFEWCDVKISPFVCYDLRFPEVFRPAAKDGAELLVVIACWPEMRSEHWVRLLQARAIENQAFTVGVNRCGEEPTLKFDGRSAAFDPMGNSLFEADGAPQVLSTTIDAEQVRSWRQQFPALKDMRN